MLHYYCVQGAYEIASHFNIDFWTRVVLQQSQQDSVVRQALVSLSALHLNCASKTVDEPCPDKDGPLLQYGRAIRALRKRIDSPNPDTIKSALTCCILFCCFEEALGNSEAAARHLNGGLDLLSVHRNSRQLEHDGHLGAMSRVFESLDLQATVFIPGRVPRLELSAEDYRDEAAFSNLDEAHGAFTRLQGSLLDFMTKQLLYKFCDKESLPPHVAAQKRFFEDRFRVWYVRFGKSDFTGNTSTGNGGPPSLGAQLLLVRWQVSKMVLEANYPIDESVFGASPNPRVEGILDTAEELFRHSQEAKANSHQHNVGHWRSFSSEVGIIAPLFTLAASCSDEALCTRALEVLAKAQRWEGLYDSRTIAEVVQKFRAVHRPQIIEKLKQRIKSNTRFPVESLLGQDMDELFSGVDNVAKVLDTTYWHALSGSDGAHPGLLIAIRSIIL
jgi:hypothetical protein